MSYWCVSILNLPLFFTFTAYSCSGSVTNSKLTFYLNFLEAKRANLNCQKNVTFYIFQKKIIQLICAAVQIWPSLGFVKSMQKERMENRSKTEDNSISRKKGYWSVRGKRFTWNTKETESGQHSEWKWLFLHFISTIFINFSICKGLRLRIENHSLIFVGSYFHV